MEPINWDKVEPKREVLRGMRISAIGEKYGRPHFQVWYVSSDPEECRAALSEFDWSQVLAVQERWMRDGIQTH